MELSREEVLHIARLARVGVTDEEVDRMSEQLSHLLESFQALQEVDTEGVPPTAQPNELRNVVKADKTRPSLPQDEVLANAPAREGEFIRVRAVLE